VGRSVGRGGKSVVAPHGFRPVTRAVRSGRRDRGSSALADPGLLLSGGSHEYDGSTLHTHTVTTHPASPRRLLGDLPARIGFNFDPGNLRAADPADRSCGVDLFRGRIPCCHLKDWARDGEGWRAAAVGDVADGIDWADLLPLTGYDGTFLVEYEPLHDTRDGIRRSLAALQAAGFEWEY